MTNTTIDWNTLYQQLSEPFAAHDIKYRAGATNRDKTKAIALAYAEPRTYEDRLNQLAPGDWQVEFTPWGDNRIICHLTIHGITRSSTGEAGDSSPDIAGTSAEAQAFKRACTKFGLGRYLYSLDTTWTDYDAKSKQLIQTPPAPRRSLAAAVDARGIGAKREKGMQLALDGLGIPLAQQTVFASQVLKRPLSRLRDISESEARDVWRAAQEVSANVAN